jgi:V8-like Glu-specific endopeptidase
MNPFQRRTLFILAGCFAVANAGGLAAEESSSRGITGTDDRSMVESTEWPWSAIGRLNHAGYRKRGHCTATLFGESFILTAAHCLFDPETGKALPLDGFRFVLALSRDSYATISRIKCTVVAPGYQPPAREKSSRTADDTAFAQLQEPVPDTTPLKPASTQLAPGTSLIHAGYGRDRPYMLSVHRDCRVVARSESSVLTTCDTHFGQSGGPLLVMEDGQFRIAAVMSGFREGLGSIASVFPDWYEPSHIPECR